MKIMYNFLIDKANWVVIIGGIITLIGTILLNIKSERESDKTAKKQEELLNQSLKLNNLMTGGNSYPLLSLWDFNNSENTAEYLFYNKGKNSLYLNQIVLTDQLGLQSVLSDPTIKNPLMPSSHLTEPFVIRFQGMEIMASDTRPMGKFPFKFVEGGYFTVNYSARNGAFIQKIVTSNINGEWLVANCVMDADNQSNILFEYVPTNFPPSLLKW